MELQQFVAETLRQIIEGVEVAGKHAVQHGGTVNPRLGVGLKKLGATAGGVLLQNVEFDIALTATEGKSTAGGVGVFFGPVGLGSKAQATLDKSL